MIEPLGPVMARTIVGDVYSSDFRYELETTDEGMQIIITNKKTGESTVKVLSEEPHDDMEVMAKIYSDERLQAIKEINRKGFIGAFIAFAIVVGVLIAMGVAAVFLPNLFGR